MVRHWAKSGATTPIADLLQLPSGERLALALALWDSLEEEGRREALPVDTVLSDELDRGWAAHLKDPAAAVPWHSIRINDQFRICFSWTAAGPEEVRSLTITELVPPGEVLLEEFLRPMGISQYRLVLALGVPESRICVSAVSLGSGRGSCCGCRSAMTSGWPDGIWARPWQRSSRCSRAALV